MRHKSCREEEPKTATHSLIISTSESGIRSCQLKAAREAVSVCLVPFLTQDESQRKPRDEDAPCNRLLDHRATLSLILSFDM